MTVSTVLDRKTVSLKTQMAHLQMASPNVQMQEIKQSEGNIVNPPQIEQQYAANNGGDIRDISPLYYLYNSKYKLQISNDDNIAIQQFIEIQRIQMEIMQGKCDTFDAIGILSGFLLAFMINDIMNLEYNRFDSEELFLIYSVLLLLSVAFGTFTLIMISFICIRLRRLLSRDYASALYFKDWQLNALRKTKLASYARAWYYGWYYNDPNDLNKKKTFDEIKSMTPNNVIKKIMTCFLLTITLYILSMYCYVIEVFNTLSQIKDAGYYHIPAIIGIVIFLLMYFGGIFLLMYFDVVEISDKQ